MCVRPFLCLMLHIRNSGIWPGGRCGAHWSFPDVTDEEEKVRERAVLCLMW